MDAAALVLPPLLLLALPLALPSWLFEVLGWVPAVVFPVGSGLQLLAIIHRRCAEGVSIPAWMLFAVANVCMFLYNEKYEEIESILGALGTAVLNVCVVIAAIRFKNLKKRAAVIASVDP